MHARVDGKERVETASDYPHHTQPRLRATDREETLERCGELGWVPTIECMIRELVQRGCKAIVCCHKLRPSLAYDGVRAAGHRAKVRVGGCLGG